jgi:hypothetical protein
LQACEFLFLGELEANVFARLQNFDAESWRPSTNNLCSASHGTFEHEARELHKRPNKFFFVQPPTFDVESWRLSKNILSSASYGTFEHEVMGSMKGQA